MQAQRIENKKLIVSVFTDKLFSISRVKSDGQEILLLRERVNILNFAGHMVSPSVKGIGMAMI